MYDIFSNILESAINSSSAVPVNLFINANETGVIYVRHGRKEDFAASGIATTPIVSIK